MNMNQIINMVIRRVVNIAVRKGIDTGIDQFSKRKGGGNADQAEIRQDKQRMRQTAKVTRRMTKF